MNAKHYKIVIDDIEYGLVSDEQEAHILEAAALVDKIIKSLSAQTEQVDKRTTAILAALKIASNYLQSEYRHQQQVEKEHSLIAVIDQQLS